MLRAVIWAAVSTSEQADDDKASIPDQLERAERFCHDHNLHVVARLIVPGHSRKYLDLYECARDMEARGITAFTQLIELWKTRGFDVLVVRDGSRFARTPSLHARVIEETMQIGAKIYSFNHGWIEPGKHHGFLALGGYAIASEMQAIEQRRHDGMYNKARRGMHTGNRPPFGFCYNADRSAIEFNEEFRPVYNAAATLLLDGVPYYELENHLANLGFVKPNGQPYIRTFFYRLFMNPHIWGHSAWNYAKRYGVWAFDDSQPVPAGTEVWRDKHQPVFTGDLAERIKAELHRRAAAETHRHPQRKYWYSGLIVCDVCKAKLVASHVRVSAKYWTHKPCLRCAYGTSSRAGRARRCPNTRRLYIAHVQQYLHDWLATLIASPELQPHFADDPDSIASAQAHVAELQHNLVDLNKQLETVMGEQLATASPVLARAYRGRLEAISQAIENTERNLAQQRAALAAQEINPARQQAFDTIKDIGLAALWQLPPAHLNTLLDTLLGDWRFRARDGKLVGRIRLTNRWSQPFDQ